METPSDTFLFRGRVINKAQLFEHSLCVELNPQLQAELERQGFKACITPASDPEDEETTDVWYHPDHWVAWDAFHGRTPKGFKSPGDSWYEQWAFGAKTQQAKDTLKEEEGEP
jgi:hypothetical protein